MEIESKLRRLGDAIERRWQPMKQVAASGQRSLAGQVRDMLALRLGATRLSTLEYLNMQLANRQLYREPLAGRYGGRWFKEWIHRQLNNIRWEALATDKASAYALFKQHGLPHPEVVAIASRHSRRYGDIPVLDSRTALAGFLRHKAPYPLFCKPIKGSKADGSHRIEAYLADSDELLFDCGRRNAVNDFVASLQDPTGFGTLFQHALLPSEETRPVCGDTISGCRIVVLLHDSGAKVFRAIWKVPTAGNFTDNFCAGKSGNLVASVEPHSGRVQRVIGGSGSALGQRTHHPDTGAELVDFQLPGWAELVETVTRAAEHFPGFRWQHWDVGLSDSGPVLFELNSAGAVDLLQIADGRGIFDEELREFVAEYGQSAKRGGLLFPERDKPEQQPAAAAPATVNAQA
jgi:hypothetical protein